jgi:hypothetical protein
MMGRLDREQGHWAMGKQPRSLPRPPMTLANMRSLGVRGLDVTCLICRHAAGKSKHDSYWSDLSVELDPHQQAAVLISKGARR